MISRQSHKSESPVKPSTRFRCKQSRQGIKKCITSMAKLCDEEPKCDISDQKVLISQMKMALQLCTKQPRHAMNWLRVNRSIIIHIQNQVGGSRRGVPDED